MKKLANLKGAKALSKQEQKSVNGGSPIGGYCGPNPMAIEGSDPYATAENGTPCPGGTCCNGECIPFGEICDPR